MPPNQIATHFTVGLTTRVDVHELLEKRVRSRISYRFGPALSGNTLTQANIVPATRELRHGDSGAAAGIDTPLARGRRQSRANQPTDPRRSLRLHRQASFTVECHCCLVSPQPNRAGEKPPALRRRRQHMRLRTSSHSTASVVVPHSGTSTLPPSLSEQSDPNPPI